MLHVDWLHLPLLGTWTATGKVSDMRVALLLMETPLSTDELDDESLSISQCRSWLCTRSALLVGWAHIDPWRRRAFVGHER
jgi:hypothetical protein